MRSARVFYKNEEAGILNQFDDGSFEYSYSAAWIQADRPSISLTLPTSQNVFRSEFLFPFFYNMLPEGTNKQSVCYNQRIDETDHFGILMATAQNDTIGAVRVVKIETT